MVKYSGNWHWQFEQEADKRYYQHWNLRRLIKAQDTVLFIKNIRSALWLASH